MSNWPARAGRRAAVIGVIRMIASKRLACLTVLAALVGAASGSAQAGGNGQLRMPAENWTIPYSGSPAAIPACSDTGVQSTIASRFSDAESTYWNSSLTIVSFEKLRPVAFRPWGLDFIPRLYCTGEVTTSDGRRRSIDFAVGEDLGIIGATYGVEWCIGGLDRSRAYAPNCKMARP
jgi:hypothetical protein